MINVKHRGNFNNIETFFRKMLKRDYFKALERYGQEGVNALKDATPVDTGLTASSWTYDISITGTEASITWYNTNVNKHVNIALILDLGHGARNGGYIEGRQYINPAIQPIFDRIAEAAWKEVVDS